MVSSRFVFAYYTKAINGQKETIKLAIQENKRNKDYI
jgi:hypothetical protein